MTTGTFFGSALILSIIYLFWNGYKRRKSKVKLLAELENSNKDIYVLTITIEPKLPPCIVTQNVPAGWAPRYCQIELSNGDYLFGVIHEKDFRFEYFIENT